MIASKKFWIGFALSAILLVVFFVTLDKDRLFDALTQANYLYLIPGVGLYLISVLFRTIRWRVLLLHMKPIGIGRLYPVVVVGYMANNLLPVRLGELVRSYYVSEREGISKTSALVTIFIERILDALTLLFFIAVVAVFVPLSGQAAGLAEVFGSRTGLTPTLIVIALSLPFLITFVALVLFAIFPDRVSTFSLTIIRPLPDRFEATIHDLVAMFLQGLIPLRNPRTLAMLFLLSLPIWLFETGLFVFTAMAFNLHTTFASAGDLILAMLSVTAIANIGSSIPAAPGGIGLFELIARETLVLLPLATIDRSVAGAFAFVVHMALLIPMIGLGQVFLWIEHLSLGRLSKAGQSDAASPNVVAQGD